MHKEAGISRDRATAVYRHNRTRSLTIYDQRRPVFIPLRSIFLRRPGGTRSRALPRWARARPLSTKQRSRWAHLQRNRPGRMH